MRRLAILLLAAGLLSGCATAGAGALPVCDGKHLRPANPSGSVLEPGTVAPAAAAGAPQHPSCGL